MVPNSEFYRIDTALVVPRPDPTTWRLQVEGMVDRELSLSMDDLHAMDLHERYVTISCVSNRVGGDLVGNAKWTGVKLTEVLDMAGVDPADQQGAHQAGMVVAMDAGDASVLTDSAEARPDTLGPAPLLERLTPELTTLIRDDVLGWAASSMNGPVEKPLDFG